MSEYSPQYKELKSMEDLSLLDEEEQRPKSRSRKPNLSTIILSITTLIFGVQALRLSLKPERACTAQVFEDGYLTDWGPAREQIKIEQVTYSSALRYNSTSKDYYREFDPSKPQYVGTPAPEIDEAWAELLGGQYLLLSEDEAMKLDDPVPIQGLWVAEVEVMHSLHCLNTLRKALSPEYYAIHDMHHLSPQLESVHIEHCIEQLRQNIQCAGDLTPVPLRPWGEDQDTNLVGTPMIHTCRNWDSFRDWYTKRGNSHGKVAAGGT